MVSGDLLRFFDMEENSPAAESGWGKVHYI